MSKDDQRGRARPCGPAASHLGYVSATTTDTSRSPPLIAALRRGRARGVAAGAEVAPARSVELVSIARGDRARRRAAGGRWRAPARCGALSHRVPARAPVIDGPRRSPSARGALPPAGGGPGLGHLTARGISAQRPAERAIANGTDPVSRRPFMMSGAGLRALGQRPEPRPPRGLRRRRARRFKAQSRGAKIPAISVTFW